MNAHVSSSQIKKTSIPTVETSAKAHYHEMRNDGMHDVFFLRGDDFS